MLEDQIMDSRTKRPMFQTTGRPMDPVTNTPMDPSTHTMKQTAKYVNLDEQSINPYPEYFA